MRDFSMKHRTPTVSFLTGFVFGGGLYLLMSFSSPDLIVPDEGNSLVAVQNAHNQIPNVINRIYQGIVVPAQVRDWMLHSLMVRQNYLN